MGSPSPAPWTFAARAAYFGDRMCAFCDHRNPAGAQFCNDCGSPLRLKPCKQCDAVNEQTAANCHKCGAECPAFSATPEATLGLAPDDPGSARAIPDYEFVAATVTQPPFDASWQAGRRLLRPDQFLLAYIAAIMIAGAYAAYSINGATPDAIDVAAKPIGTGELNAPAVAPAMATTTEAKPVEPETTAALQAPSPPANSQPPKRASSRQRPVPVSATKRASAHQRSVPVSATRRASAHERSVPEAPPPDRWQTMHVNERGQ